MGTEVLEEGNSRRRDKSNAKVRASVMIEVGDSDFVGVLTGHRKFKLRSEGMLVDGAGRTGIAKDGSTIVVCNRRTEML